MHPELTVPVARSTSTRQKRSRGIQRHVAFDEPEATTTWRSVDDVKRRRQRPKPGRKQPAAALPRLACGSALERLLWKDFDHHSSRKSHASVPACGALVLRSTLASFESERLAASADDLVSFGKRNRNESIPATAVPLGRFAGRPVLGQDLYDHVVESLDDQGLLGGRHAHLAGKAEVKCVDFDTPITGAPASAKLGSEWREALIANGVDYKHCIAAVPHRDSGVQALNKVFVPGELVTINDNVDDVAVNFRVVMVLPGSDDMLMLVDSPTHGPDGTHDGWRIETVRLKAGDMFIFGDGSPEGALAGAALKHMAAVVRSDAAAAGGQAGSEPAAVSSGGCLAYLVVDLGLCDSAPEGVPAPAPPPPLDAPAIPREGMRAWGHLDSEGTSNKFWSQRREELSAISFLTKARKRLWFQAEIERFDLRRQHGVRESGCLPKTASAQQCESHMQSLLAEGRTLRSDAGAATFLTEEQKQQLPQLRERVQSGDATAAAPLKALLAEAHTRLSAAGHKAKNPSAFSWNAAAEKMFDRALTASRSDLDLEPTNAQIATKMSALSFGSIAPSTKQVADYIVNQQRWTLAAERVDRPPLPQRQAPTIRWKDPDVVQLLRDVRDKLGTAAKPAAVRAELKKLAPVRMASLTRDQAITACDKLRKLPDAP